MTLLVHRQEHPHTCLPACIRIVLEFWGRLHTEEELARLCGSVPRLGTLPSAAVDGLEGLGYRAFWFENASLERLIQLLDDGLPVIAFLRAADLPHGRAGVHAVVISALDGEHVVCVDPALGAELRLTLADFLRAWTAIGAQGMLVWLAD